MKRKIKTKIVCIGLIILTLAVYLGICASKNVVAIAKSTFNANASTASYVATGFVFDGGYEELFNVVYGNDGKVSMITANGLKLNVLTRNLAEKCLEVYNTLAKVGVQVPIGALTGISFLSGTGRKLTFKIIYINSVKCEFYSYFESVGVNQTRQSLYLKIIPDCKIVTGLKTYALQNEIEVLCYENFIIGSVPETFVNFSTYTAKTN